MFLKVPVLPPRGILGSSCVPLHLLMLVKICSLSGKLAWVYNRASKTKRSIKKRAKSKCEAL